jgi:hypothetical protein
MKALVVRKKRERRDGRGSSSQWPPIVCWAAR